MAKRKAAEVGELWVHRVGDEERAYLVLKVEKIHREIGLDSYQYTMLESADGNTISFERKFPIRQSYTAGIRWYKVG